MSTSTKLSRLFPSKNRTKRRRRQLQQHSRLPAMERLEARQLLTADLMWAGDQLQITGSDRDNFIAVQQDELGLKIFTEDAVFSEYEGRSFDSATSILVDGRGGNDVLFSYQTDIPVTLLGDTGNDFLYSDNAADVLDAGDGFNWVLTEDTQAIGDNAFGIPGLNLMADTLTHTPQFDQDGRIGLQVDVEGAVDVAGVPVDVTGRANVALDGVDVNVAGTVAAWDDAFGIAGVDLSETSMVLSAGTDVHDGDGYRVDLSSNLTVSDTDIRVEGSVEVTDALTTAAFTGSVAHWDNAFGIAGLELNDSEFQVIGHTDGQGDSGLQIDLMGEMQVSETDIAVSGRVEITPDQIDALFSGSVDNWDNAFGVAGLDFTHSDLSIAASSNRNDQTELQIGVTGDLNIQGATASVSGTVDIEADRIAGRLAGSVASKWDDAFGVTGLDLEGTQFSVHVERLADAGNSLTFDLAADMDLAGTDVAVTGQVDVNDDRVSGSLTGVIAGTWTSAFGIVPLQLQDTILNIRGSRTSEGTELSLSVAAGMNLLGTDLGISGTVDVTSEGWSPTLTGVVSGEWVDAFGVPSLQLKDTSLTIGRSADNAPATETASAGLDIRLDTDLQLFGSYVDMIGDLNISSAGVDLSFSPPAAIGFTDLLGIEGFSLNDADLTVTTGTEGLQVAVASTIDMGNVDVELEGAFAVTRNSVEANLTGQIAGWDNAFEVPGLNLNDVVLTLAAESGPGGASLAIGLGAAIEIGNSELKVAGLVGLGATGLEVAFRGETDQLGGGDLIDFANTLNHASDPNAATIPSDALGDLELRQAYVNFAPRGGNDALGIADGFGIGGAFYDDGHLLGSGEFVVDLAAGVFQVGLDVPGLDLGPVEISDVFVDIRIAPADSHYHVAGTAELLGAEVSLEGKISSNDFSLTGQAAIDMQGLSASVTFIVDTHGVRFEATAGGEAMNAIKDKATAEIRAVAEGAQKAIDTAQAGVDAARREVNKLEAELAEARVEAQKEVDEVKEKIDSAKVLVDKAAASRNYWYSQKQIRYRKWRSAVADTNRAVWYKKAYYKGIEVSRYSSYVYAAGRYSAQVVVYNSANIAYKAVRDAAGWVLDSAGVEANPNVLRIKGLLAVANLGLDAADLVLDGAEHVNAAALQSLKYIDSVRVNRITIAGNVSSYKNAGVNVTIECSIGGQIKLLTLNASTEDLVRQLSSELLAAIA